MYMYTIEVERVKVIYDEHRSIMDKVESMKSRYLYQHTPVSVAYTCMARNLCQNTPPGHYVVMAMISQTRHQITLI